MKRNGKLAALEPVAFSMPAGERDMHPSSAENAALEDHRRLMTRGELMFCLRDVHRYWSTPRISSSEMEELEQQNLIQRSATDICAIRLTEQGALVKHSPPVNAP